MANRHIQLATAFSFVRLFLRTGRFDDTISSAEIAAKCDAWCAVRRLYRPSFRELNQALRHDGYIRHKSNGQRMWRGAVWNDEPDALIELLDTDGLRRLTQTAMVIPLRVFCELTGVGRSTFYALSARGEAPTSYRRGRRVFITALDAVEWCAARDRHAAVLCIVCWVEDRRASVSRVKDRVTAWTSAGA